MPYFLASLIGVFVVLGLPYAVEPAMRRWVVIGFFAHVAGTIGLLWLHTVQGGDMGNYALNCVDISNMVRIDPFRWMPEVMKLIFRMDSVITKPDSAGATLGLASLVFLVVGDSMDAVCFVIGFIVLIGQVFMLKVVSEELAPEEKKLAAVGCLLVPSVVFWSSGIIKEAFCVFGMGLVLFGLDRSLRKRRLIGVPILGAGAVIVAGVKPYVLFPFVFALSSWFFTRRGGRVRIRYILLAIGIAVLGVVALGSFFPQFGVENLGASISAQRYASLHAGGGSLDEIDTSDGDFLRRDTSLVGQLKYLPVALVTAVARPFLFEAASVTQIAAALEASVILVLLVVVVWRAKWRKVLDELLHSPLLLASTVFVLTFGTAVGLTTQNLGTLSRYRVPMMPALVTAMLILQHRLVRKAASASATAAAAPEAAPAARLAPVRRRGIRRSRTTASQG